MTRSRRLGLWLARGMAATPITFLIVSLLLCAVAAAGFARFSVDAGADLLVGSRSNAAQVYDRFSQQFGGDPIVVVFSAQNPSAWYIEQNNLLRFAALESDLAQDDRVASVLGPGTIAAGSQRAVLNEITKTSNEYSAYVIELVTALYLQQHGNDPTKIDQNQLNQIRSSAGQFATVQIEGQLVQAAAAASKARQDFQKAHATDTSYHLIVDQENAASAAASQITLPQYFDYYFGGRSGRPDQADARKAFDDFAAAYGECYGTIAQLLNVSASCQVFLERLLLDLSTCPTLAQINAANQAKEPAPFCQPKKQWAAVLPHHQPGAPSYAVLTVRLKPGHENDAQAVRSRIENELRSGGAIPQGASQATTDQIRSLGPLTPTECGAAVSGSCPFVSYTIAGAPLLAQGVATSITHLLEVTAPAALLLMAVLLVAVFRVRGRIWPLVAASGAAVMTLGLTLATGAHLTPATLAGVPVLVGLGVDYAVQVVARFDEERRRGLGVEAALRQVLTTTGPATAVAAVATLSGLAALALVAGIDAGPLTAIPLVAEFALVLLGGVVIAWFAAVFVALPAAALGAPRLPAPAEPPAVAPAVRTSGLADRWRVVLAAAAVPALVGWALLPRVPVQTDVERLLAPSLTELKDVQAVRAQTGYTNEVDLFIEGQVVGPYDANATSSGPPANLCFQQGLAGQIVHDVAGVAIATSIADVLPVGRGGSCTSASGGGASPQPSPSPTPGAPGAATPGTTPVPGTPTPAALAPGDVVRAARAAAAAVAQATPAPTPVPTPAATPGGTAAPSAAPSATVSPSAPSASTTVPQTGYICDLRLSPPLSRTLVGGIPIRGVSPCPPLDFFTGRLISQDTTPIDPESARIALGVRPTTAADESALVDAVRREVPASLPAGINAVNPTGVAVLGVQAYQTLTSRAWLVNVVPLLVVALVLLAVQRSWRRALLPVLPTALAAGWAPLLLLLLGRLPGAVGEDLGAFNPLTVVLGALVIALATEFGVVLLGRFEEELASGLDADAAAASALGAVGRAVRVSALTLGAGFAVLALSTLLPGGLPLIGAFGLTVLLDLGLAVGAVFLVMLPVAVALERAHPVQRLAVARPAPEPLFGGGRGHRPGAGAARRPAERDPAAADVAGRAWVPAAEAAEGDDAAPQVASEAVPEDRPSAAPLDDGGPVAWVPAEAAPPAAASMPASSGGESTPQAAEPAPADQAPPAAPAADAPAGATAPPAARFPGMSGRRRAAAPGVERPSPDTGAASGRRLPGVSGRPRGAQPPPAAPPPAPLVGGSTPSPAPRPRRPGSVIPRRQPPNELGSASVPPAASPAHTDPPAAPAPPAPSAAAPSPAPPADEEPPERPVPPAGDQPPQGPSSGGRRRRRRPPPSVRRQGRPPG